MCLRPASPPPVPDDTAHVARLAFPRGNLLLSLRDRLGPVFDDRRFGEQVQQLLPGSGHHGRLRRWFCPIVDPAGEMRRTGAGER